MDMIEQATPRRRAIREDVTRRRQAAALIRPLAQRIGGWQAQVARLAGSSERARGRPELAADIDVELRALEAIIRDELQLFASQHATWPEAIRAHGRVTDTLRAANSVLAGLQRAKESISSRESRRVSGPH